MATEVRFRRGNTADITPFVPAQSEIIHNVTTNRLHVGDGSTQGGHELALMSDVLVYSNRMYDTRAAAIAAKIPAAVNLIAIGGYVSLNDGGLSYYSRVGTEPAHGIKFQNTDGSWWTITTDRLTLEQAGGGVTRSGADNSAAIARAITYLQTKSGGNVHLGAGQYTFSTKITLPSKCHIWGEGRNVTFLIFNGTHGVETTDTTTLMTGNTAGGASYWGLHGITLYGSRDLGATVGIGIYTYSRCYVLEDVSVQNFPQEGINSSWFTGAAWDDPAAWKHDLFMEARYNGVYVSYCGTEGILFNGPHDSQWVNVLAGLNSQKNLGDKSGISVFERSGGLQATNCHSWGDTQRHAWQLNCGWLHMTNCEADDAAVALVYMEGSNISWVGGVQFGAIFSTPPTTQDKAMVGFQISWGGGPACENIIIDTIVNNCPEGAVAFGNVTGKGRINIIGTMDPSIVTGSKGYAGNLPNWDIYITIKDAAGQGTLRRMANGDALSGFALAADPTSPWIEGLMYWNTTTKKLRVYNGTAWIDK